MRTNERRGSVVVLVAVLMVVLLGFGAFAVDISQMHAYKSELRRTTDAAALAAALQLLDETQFASATAAAQQLVIDNPVMGSIPQVVSVQYGEYSQRTGYTFAAACTDPGCTVADMAAANAVRLTLSDSGTFYLAQLLGRSRFSLTADAVAYLPVFVTPCAAPWAIPRSVWDAKFAVLPSLDPVPLTTLRNWANTDVRKLFTIKQPENEAAPFPGREQFFGAVNLPPYPAIGNANGQVNYSLNVALATCHVLGTDAELQTKMGWLDNWTVEFGTVGGVGVLCSKVVGSACHNASAQVGIAVRVPIVDDIAASEGNPCSSNVLYDEDEYTIPSLIAVHGIVKCVRVADMATFVVHQTIVSGSERGTVNGVFAGAQSVGPVRGYQQRPLLAQ